MPYCRINFESEMIMMQHRQVMTDLEKIPDRVSEAFTKSKHLINENKYYWWVTNWVMTPGLDTEYVCPSLTLCQIDVRFYIVWLLPGSQPCSKVLGFLPPGLMLTKYGDSVSPSIHYPFKLRMMLKSAPSFRFPGYAVLGHKRIISTMMEKSISLEHLGLWQNIYIYIQSVCLSGFHETHK